jgi:hypothetical protein
VKRWLRRSRATEAPMMPAFLEECALLASLESFDPDAFRGDADVPQELCNFVVAIALIYNDLKDAVYIHVVMAGLRPGREPQKTRLWGALGGVQFHAFRAIAALLHELFKLIQDNRELLNHRFFVAVLQQLHRVSREAWQALVDVAFEATPKDQLGKRLLLLRNKVFFHYDPQAISQGYAQYFLSTTKRDDRAYLSRGGSMRSTRFYFADAAAEGYLHALVGHEQVEELKEDLGDIIDRVNNGLMMIIGNFIQRRRYSFRTEVEP